MTAAIRHPLSVSDIYMAAPGLRQSWQGSAQSDSSLNDPSRACGTRLVQQIEQSWDLSIHLHDAPLTGCGRSIGKIDTLNIWTAPLKAEISEAGPVRTHSTDLLLNGKSGQGGGSSSWDWIHQTPFHNQLCITRFRVLLCQAGSSVAQQPLSRQQHYRVALSTHAPHCNSLFCLKPANTQTA